MEYKNILIVYKHKKPEAFSLACKVKDWLKARCIKSSISEAPLRLEPENQYPDFVIVIGGDGTLIGLARKLVPEKIPLFGLNLGTLGFLTSTGINDWQNKLEAALKGSMHLRSCLALQWEIYRDGVERARGWAINEVVIGRGLLARLVNLEIYINNYYMGILRSDGAIVCTPLGSSAYAVSAGGSLVHPSLALSCLVPICPFPAAVNPLILPENTFYEFKIIEPTQESELTVDGQEGYKLAIGDSVKISAHANTVHIFGEEENFLEKLGDRGFTLRN